MNEILAPMLFLFIVMSCIKTPFLNLSFYILTICVAFCTATLAKSNVDVSPLRRRVVLRGQVRPLRVFAGEKLDKTVSPLKLHVRHEGPSL